jgi:hypothetical protein
LPAGAAFCGQCGAPQVRVPETVISTAVSENQSPVPLDDRLPRAPTNAAVNWRHALPSASSAGLAMAVASLLPYFNTLFPVWMLGGGWLAVVLYRRRLAMPLTSSTVGGKVGALAGLLGFLFFAVFTSSYLAIATLIMHQGEQIRAVLRSVIDQAAANNHDARTQALAQWVQTPQGLTVVVTFSMFLFFVAFLLLSTAGGVFAASLGRRRLR